MFLVKHVLGPNKICAVLVRKKVFSKMEFASLMFVTPV